MENKNFAFQTSNILIKLASEKEEYDQIWKLRYFDLILNYNKDQVNEEEIDKDIYDDVCDHLIAVDTLTNKVVGTYRLIKKSHLKDIKAFLTETEFDLSNLKQYEILEVGRAVVKEEYRDGITISMLWKGVIRYAVSENIDFMIGTASFHGINPHDYEDTLSYLHYNHLSSEEIRCYALKDSYSPIDLKEDYDLEVAKKNMPPLIKGYLRLGATIGDGAYLDVAFNSLDVLIVLKISEINPRYLKRYME